MALVRSAELRPDASFTLGCRMSVKGGFIAPQETTYSAYRFAVQRPEHGKRHATVECPRCGDTLPFSVLSVDDALRRRRTYRTTWILTSAVLFAIPIVIAIATAERDWLPVIPLLIPGIGCALAAVFHPPAVTGIRSRKRRGQHMLAR